MTRMAHIRVADDEINIAATLALILQTHGHTVAIANSGEQALQLAAAHPPDMLISDVAESGVDGFELADRVGKWFQSFPA